LVLVLVADWFLCSFFFLVRCGLGFCGLFWCVGMLYLHLPSHFSVVVMKVGLIQLCRVSESKKKNMLLFVTCLASLGSGKLFFVGHKTEP
jgi:hypothetical protein